MNSFTAVSEVNPGGPRVDARFGRTDTARAFRAAVRHSRHVRILRVAVPLTTAAVFLSGVAQAAAQDVTKPDMLELHGIRATMEMRDNVTFETTAKDGLYNTKTEQLTLTQDIVVTSSSGYQAFLNEAVVDVRGSNIVSDKPVEVKTATWTINANRMEVRDSGDLMRFERGVFVTLIMDNTASTAGGGRKP